MTDELGEGRGRGRASEKLGKAKAKVRETASAAKARASEAYDSASMKAERAYESASLKAEHAYDATRRGAAKAGRKTAQGVDDSPLAVLFGGIALGALVGALLPRTRREAEALGPIGRKVNQSAAAAARAAREAGSQKFDSMGINRDAAKAKVDQFVDTAVKAAGSAGKAAAKSVREGKSV